MFMRDVYAVLDKENFLSFMYVFKNFIIIIIVILLNLYMQFLKFNTRNWETSLSLYQKE